MVSGGFVLELALIQTIEVTYLKSADLILRTWDHWNSRLAHGAICRVFISWEPVPSIFLKVNFDGSVMGTIGEAGFVIKGLDSRLVAVGGSHLFGPSIPGEKS